MTQGGTRTIRARLARFAMLTMLWTLLGIAGPVQAQSNAPSDGGAGPVVGIFAVAGVGLAVATRHRRIRDDVPA